MSVGYAHATSDQQRQETSQTAKSPTYKTHEKPSASEQSVLPLVNITDPWSAAYTATRRTKLKISNKCKREAFLQAAKQHKKITGKPIGEHLHQERQRFARGEVNASEYFDHMTKCESFCGRLVGLLLSCNLDALSHLVGQNTMLVLFGNSKTKLSPSVQQKLRTFAAKIKNQGYKLLLYGSASRLNRRDTHPINKELSKARAESVRGFFIKQGIDKKSIFTTWINQETPRLSHKRIARRLGYLKVWKKLKQRKHLPYMDQNVLVVAWRS